jgi:UDP-N-acetylglucosamine acyltransferase
VIDPRAVIHATAIIDPDAQVHADVAIGAYCVVGAEVTIAAGTVLHPHVVLHGPMLLEENCIVHAFAVLGASPQRRESSALSTAPSLGVRVGTRSVIREHATIHAGTVRTTVLGSDSLLMVSAHLGHDVVVGARCVLANCVQLAGHVSVEDDVTFGGLSGVSQHHRVGQGAFVAAGAMCERDVPPWTIVQGDRARVRTVNRIGLLRSGASEDELVAMTRAFRAIYGRPRAMISPQEGDQQPTHARVTQFLDWHRQRGIVPAFE